MPKRITDEQLDKEIEKLKNSPLVKMAQKEQAKKYKPDPKRKQLYQLRWLEKKGKEIERNLQENIERIMKEYEARQAN